jgi:hypothetical protein
MNVRHARLIGDHGRDGSDGLRDGLPSNLLETHTDGVQLISSDLDLSSRMDRGDVAGAWRGGSRRRQRRADAVVERERPSMSKVLHE